MSRASQRALIVQQIIQAAALYRQNLVGRRFLYVFDGRYIEVLYKAQNFRHLTGIDTAVSARRFYQDAVHGRLQARQIFFNQSHPYALCQRKVKHICDIATMASSENFMLEEITTDTCSYRFGTTDLKFTLCMNKEMDANGNPIGDCYVVQSLRDEDCFSKSRSAYTVTHILARSNDADRYTDVLFLDGEETIATLPACVKTLLHPSLLQQ